MYTAVSVCTVKLTRLNAKNIAAYVYLFLVSYAACVMGSRSWKVDRRVKRAGRVGESYPGASALDPKSGVCDLPSVGR